MCSITQPTDKNMKSTRQNDYRMYISFKIRPCPDPDFSIIYMRLQQDKRRIEFSLNLKVKSKNWNTEKNIVRGNPEIGDLLTQYESKARSLALLHPDKSLSEIRDLLLGKERKMDVRPVDDHRPKTLIEIGELLIQAKERKLALGKLAPDTIRTQKNLQERMKTVFKETKWIWPLDDIRSKQLEELEIWVSNRPGWKGHSQSKTLKYFKEVIKFGMGEGLIPNRPICLRVVTPRTNHKALTKVQIDFLQDRIWSNQRLQTVVDVFLFQCFTGLAYADAYQFRKDLHLKIENGLEIIELNRMKSPRAGEPYRVKVPLLPAAKRILEKYNYELPILSNQKYNGHLKLIGEFLNLGFQLTSHVSRKTFCSVLANLGLQIEILSAWVGHATVKETLETYTRFAPETMEEKIRDLGYGT